MQESVDRQLHNSREKNIPSDLKRLMPDTDRVTPGARWGWNDARAVEGSVGMAALFGDGDCMTLSAVKRILKRKSICTGKWVEGRRLQAAQPAGERRWCVLGIKEVVTLCHMLCWGDSSSMTAWDRTGTDSKWLLPGRTFTTAAVSGRSEC